MEKMFIPKRIKVGFQKRGDTFTGKLSYIIYYDEKGKLRKEASWNTWKDDSIETVEFDNVPQAGYLFNKGVQRDGYWGSGRSVIRVYDSRDFEFEISVDNLMGLLMHSDVSKRDIVEQCVFAWQGTELVLLPVNSQEYLASVEYTQKQDQKISSKQLVEGYTYQAKKLDCPLVYLGYREWFDWNTGYVVKGKITQRYDTNATYTQRHEHKGRKHVFTDGTNFIVKTAADLSAILEDKVHADYAHLVESFFNSMHSQPIVSVTPCSTIIPTSYPYNNYFYFVTKKYLITFHTNYQTSYKNGENTLRPTLDYSVQDLIYNPSLEINSSSQRNIVVQEVQEFVNAYRKKYEEYVSHEQYQLNIEEGKKFLLDNGVVQAYNVVLFNEKEVLKTPH